MIFNQDLIFIHIGKTGGMSCSQYLLNNLKPTVYNCHADAAKEIVPFNTEDVVALTGIGRHCTLSEALAFIQHFNGKTLDTFAKVIAVIRNPYRLEYSLYLHRRKPQIKARQRQTRPDLVAIAEGPFAQFVTRGGFHREGHRQEDFFQIDGKTPEQVELIRFEALDSALPEALAPFRKTGAEHPFPHRNITASDTTLEDLLTPDVEEAIYLKHRYMFDSGLYERKKLGSEEKLGSE